MKSHVTLPLFLFFASLAFAQMPTPTGAFHFNGDFLEQFSNVSADTSSLWYNRVSDPKGNPDAAVQITGGSVDFSPAPFALMDSGDHSVAFWFRNDGSLWPAEVVFTAPGYSFRYNGFFDQLEFRFRPSDTTLIATVTPADGAWAHIAISVDRDDSMRYYLNGVLRYQEDISKFQNVNVSSSNPSLRMGRANVSLDEVLFFDKAISQEEVVAIYQDNLTSIQPAQKLGIRVFPNPASEKIYFENAIPNHTSYQLFDMAGSLVKQGTIQQNGIQVADLQDANYFVVVSLQDKQVSIPVCVKH